MKKLMIVSTLLLIALIWFLNRDADAWIERTKFHVVPEEKKDVALGDARDLCPIGRMERARLREQVQVVEAFATVSTSMELAKTIPIARLSKGRSIAREEFPHQVKRSPKRAQFAATRKKIQIARAHRRSHYHKSHSDIRVAKAGRSHIRGIASWYGGKFLGRKTASGVPFVAHKMTAAHKHLPFGTKLLVENRMNGRTAIVTVNDRGPFIKDRVLDLSPAAAHKLGMVTKGITPVVATIVNDS